mgnify:CR=1 FL=1
MHVNHSFDSFELKYIRALFTKYICASSSITELRSLNRSRDVMIGNVRMDSSFCTAPSINQTALRNDHECDAHEFEELARHFLSSLDAAGGKSSSHKSKSLHVTHLWDVSTQFIDKRAGQDDIHIQPKQWGIAMRRFHEEALSLAREKRARALDAGGEDEVERSQDVTRYLTERKKSAGASIAVGLTLT